MDLGLEVCFEPGLGAKAEYVDSEYEQAGAKPLERASGFSESDIVLRVCPPTSEERSRFRKGAWLIGFLDPFNEKDLGASMATQGVTAVSVEMMPRSTLAQKMDAISSQANIAGYMAVIMAADRSNQIFPMMMTPSGTISPAKVFVVGIGVAGLQAIATAKRLGARVTAFDTRSEALEQAESLGAKALRIDLGETGSTGQGYAKELTPEQLEKQRQEQAKVCAQSDVVITTAKLFGRPAPKLIRADVVSQMRPGSVVVDLAAETGGNVEGTVLNEEHVTDNGVRLIGYAKLEWFASKDSSAMYANNLYNFVSHFWNAEEKRLEWRPDDDILKGAALTHDGSVIHERFK